MTEIAASEKKKKDTSIADVMALLFVGSGVALATWGINQLFGFGIAMLGLGSFLTIWGIGIAWAARD